MWGRFVADLVTGG